MAKFTKINRTEDDTILRTAGFLPIERLKIQQVNVNIHTDAWRMAITERAELFNTRARLKINYINYQKNVLRMYHDREISITRNLLTATGALAPWRLVEWFIKFKGASDTPQPKKGTAPKDYIKGKSKTLLTDNEKERKRLSSEIRTLNDKIIRAGDNQEERRRLETERNKKQNELDNL
jgi:hypothetical protein